MAFVATLILDGKRPGYNLQECEYELFQPIDSNGKPCANPSGGLIKFIVKVITKDITFHQWMLSKSQVKKGEIEFTLPDGDKRVIKFELAHCVYLYEYFTNEETLPASNSDISKIGESIGPLAAGVAGTVANPLIGLPILATSVVSLFGSLIDSTSRKEAIQMFLKITISATKIVFGDGAKFTNNELL
jgi:hypothetical protein